MTSLTPTTRLAEPSLGREALPLAEPPRALVVAATEPQLPAVQQRTDNAPGPTLAAPRTTGGWSQKSWSLSRDLWAVGGLGWRTASVANALLGGAVALGRDGIGFFAPSFMPQPTTTPTGDLIGMIKDRALHPPAGLDDMTRAMRLDPAPRWNDTISYPEMLARIAQDPQMVTAITEAIAARGFKAPQFVVRSLLARPELFMRIWAWGPQDLRAGFEHLNRAYQAGQVGGTTRDHQLPQSIDLNTFDLSTIKTNRVNPTQIAGPLHYGELPATGPVDRERQNRLVAETFDRLSANEHLPEAQRFEVRFGDSTYTRMDDFLRALRASGHQVEVRARMQGADLPDLSIRNADGSFTKLAIPTFTTLGLTGADGREALVPYVHVELEIQVTPPASGTGPRFNGSAAWFQGINNIGFFPGSVERDSAWTNGRDYMTVRGDTAIATVLDASRYADVVATAAALENRRADDYGGSGNCGDSVLAVLRGALAKLGASSDITADPEFERRILASPHRTFAFPSMINPSRFRAELERRIADTSLPESERQGYRELLETVGHLQDDAAPGALPNRDAARRSLDMLELVWPQGQEPFEAIPHAKAALRTYLNGNN